MVAEAGMLLAVLTSAVILLYFERRPFSDLGLTLKGHARGLWYGLLAAILLYLIGFGLSLALGEVEVTGFQFDPLNLLATFVFCLLVALAEEIMMRGYILGRLLHTRMNKFLSLFVSALLFALLHLFNPNLAFLPMLNLLLAGMFIGASYLYTRNLCFPISLHLFWNWIQGPILGYQVSGNDFGTSLLTLHLPEENVLNGGAFGFEGSLICTVLMIIFTILIVWWGENGRRSVLLYPDHAKLNPFPVGIHVHHSDHDMLVDGHDFRRIGDVSFGQLGEVYKPVLLDAYIDESSEIGNIAYDARQNHAFAQVCDGAHVLVKFKYLDRFTRVATRLVEFLHDVLQGRQAHSRCDVVRYLDFWRSSLFAISSSTLHFKSFAICSTMW